MHGSQAKTARLTMVLLLLLFCHRGTGFQRLIIKMIQI
jgi:hypothetical protein